MKLTELLDQIDRLDQAATQAPWKPHFGGNPHDEWLSVEPEKGARTICTVTDDHRPNAEFIALARTALPQLAEALRAVLDVLDDYTMPGKLHDPTGIAGAELETLEQYIREAIGDAMGADDA